MGIKLYYARQSGSLAARILIHELNLKCEFIAVTRKKLITQYNENFLTINPKGRLPTLITEDGIVITENQVIQQYLVDTYAPNAGAQSLLPPINNVKRYQILEWISFLRIDLQSNYALIINPQIPPNLKENYFIPLMKKHLNYLENYIQNKEFLVGKNFTIADGYCFVILDWLKDINIDINNFKNLQTYHLKLKERPAIITSLQEKNLL